MTPWMVLTLFTAAINLFVFIFLRGRWGRVVFALALAALVGTVIGHAAGEVMRLHLFRIGDFNLLSASVGAHLAMLATLLLGVALQERRVEEVE